MTDAVRAGPESETPVNPYSLLEAVNSSSDTAHTAWLIFLAIMTYFMIAVAGVTHKHLLLETAVTLPILQVSIEQAQFFQFAPVILLLLHLGVVSQLVLLARKTLEFDHAVRGLEATDRRTHPLRLELHNFFFVQAVAGPHRSRIMGTFLHGMSWLTLVILPVVLLLYIQLAFLPYHDRTITWTHRICLVLDIAMLVLIGVFLMRSETSFFRAFWMTGRRHPASFLVTAALLGAAGLFSFLVATIPDEPLDELARTVQGGARVSPAGRERRDVAGFAMPLAKGRADGSLFGMFHRNLIVTDTTLAGDRDKRADEPTLSLRGRDLRYARLDRSDLHKADLTGADLDGASLVGADLREVRLQCADATLLLLEGREAARCGSARGANLTRAKLGGARMLGIDLTDAKLEEANLEGAELPYALLSGADFTSARLEKADLTGGAQAQGANFLLSSLQGADLTGAQLQRADFSNAAMQGAVLAHARLEGAVLRDADLEGADLLQARLHGADLTGSKLRAADLRGVGIWQTAPPAPDGVQLADLAELVIRPPDEGESAELGALIERLDGSRLQERVREALSVVLVPAEARKWSGSPEQARWQGLAASAGGLGGEAYKGQLTDYLARLMCKSRWSGGAVATGVAKRAQSQHFRGDMAVIYDRLRMKDCPAAETVSKRALQNLATAADVARGN